jgi:hypothetical protein
LTKKKRYSAQRAERAGGQGESLRGFRKEFSSLPLSETHRRMSLIPTSSVGCSTKSQWLGYSTTANSGESTTAWQSSSRAVGGTGGFAGAAKSVRATT